MEKCFKHCDEHDCKYHYFKSYGKFVCRMCEKILNKPRELEYGFFGYVLAKAMGALAYFASYTLMTKFSIDMKLHEAESQSRSQTFYSRSDGQQDPTSLNDRSIADRVFKDSMVAALAGHPGGYYISVSGGEPGNMYTGEVLVSPPNYARMTGAFNGFLDLLWENFLHMGDSNPDSFTPFFW